MKCGHNNAGYSFPEVMFAVVVLGIGFIMLAAVFPVALQQSKSSLDETKASAIARRAANYLQSIAVDPPSATISSLTAIFPATGGSAGPIHLWPGDVRPIVSPGTASPNVAWDAVRNNM